MTNRSGFTLLECLIVLAVIALLSSLAAPSLARLVARNKAYDYTNRLYASLHFARDYAISNSVRIVICKTRGGTHCRRSGDWSEGWLIFEDTDHNADCVDSNGDRRCDADNGRILRIGDGFGDGRYALFGNAHIANRVWFDPSGFANGSNGTFSLCRDQAGKTVPVEGIVVSNPGRTRVTRDTKRLSCS